MKRTLRGAWGGWAHVGCTLYLKNCVPKGCLSVGFQDPETLGRPAGFDRIAPEVYTTPPNTHPAPQHPTPSSNTPPPAPDPAPYPHLSIHNLHTTRMQDTHLHNLHTHKKHTRHTHNTHTHTQRTWLEPSLPLH